MRVLVADDHSLFRDGITSLLEAAGYQVVAQVGDGHTALEATRQLQPDLVLLDIDMPEMGGLEALDRIKAEFPEISVVILTVSNDDRDLFAAIERGADGYLLKDLQAQDFIEMLQGVERGDAAITRKTAARLMNRFQKMAQQTMGDANELTDRELEVLEKVGDGMANRDIASALFISENTVKYHLRNILQKLGAKNRTEAVTYAISKGIIRRGS
ncbi:MAG: response regulator transcription factor [Anaerolineae bacterium]|nr:response regulator transcription factor [Anaerolineae bacterium]MBL6965053.1 response regulator transcription factor [Anaerolineales bacterium]